MVQAVLGGGGTQAGVSISELIASDDVDIELGSGSDALIRLSSANAHASSSNEDLVIALSNNNQSLHITDKAAVATDWNLADATHPTVYIHSNTTPATDFLAVGAHDGTTADIDVQGGTTLTLSIAGTPQATVTAAVLNIPTGNTYQINATDVLSGSTLGSGVTASSLTSLGVQAEDLDMGGFDIDNAGFVILNGATAPATSQVYVLNDNSGDLTLHAVSGKTVNLAIAGTDYLTVSATLAHMSGSNDGGNVQLRVSNTSNTTGSDTRLLVFGAGTSAGDPYIEWQVSGGSSFYMGVDNDQSDRLVISRTAIGNNDTMRVTTAGATTFDDSSGADFTPDFVCQVCWWTGLVDPGSCPRCGSDRVQWQDDVEMMMSYQSKEDLGIRALAGLGVVELGTNNDGSPWLGISVQRGIHYGWSMAAQNRMRMDAQYETLNQRLQALERAA